APHHAAGGPERTSNIRLARGGREIALRPRGADAYELSGNRWNSERPREAFGEQRRLVEAALTLALVRERHRNQRLDVVWEKGSALLDRQITERPRQRALPRKLEGVQRLSQGALVGRGRSRVVVVRRARRARPADAPRIGSPWSREVRAERRRRATDVAVGRREPVDRAPATATEGVAAAGAERRVADRAQGGKDEVERRDGPARVHRCAVTTCGPGEACSSAGSARSGLARSAPAPRTLRIGAASRTRGRAAARGDIPRRPRGSRRAARRPRRGARGSPASRARGPRPFRTGRRPRRASPARE